MSAKGKAQGGEMMQLTEAGIPAWRYLAEAIGVSTAEVMKLSEKGLIPAEKAIAAINAGMKKDFGGMMAQQATTAAGKFSNLQDSMDRLGTTIGNKLLPTVKDLTDQLIVAASTANLLVEWNDKVTEAYQEQATTVEKSASTYREYVQQIAIFSDSEREHYLSLIDSGAAVTEKGDSIASLAELLGIYSEAQFAAAKSEQEATAAAAAHNAAAARWTGMAGEYITATENANTARGDGTSALNDLNIGLQKYNDLLLFNIASAGLDAEAALRLGVAMGVVDTASILAADGVEALRKKYDENGDGAVDAGQNTYDYLKAVEALQSGIAALPDQKTIRIDVQTSGQVPNIPGTGGSPNTPIPLANGGDYMVTRPTTFMAGEAGPERVQVTPQGGSSTVNNYNLSIQTTTTPVSVPHEFAQARAFVGGY
jgi:hypothetical protein